VVLGAPGRGKRVDASLAAIAAFTVVGFAIRVAVLVRPIEVIDRLFIPDDTYYTLTIARSIAYGHGPTVDGRTLTSGFQPLLGFVMVPVFWFTHNPDIALRVDLALLVLVDTATIVVLSWVAYRLAGRVAAMVAAGLWAVSPVAISMALGGLETSLAILGEVGLVAAWIWAGDRPSRGRWAVTGVVAGLAILARVDAVALVALLCGVQLWRGTRRSLVPFGAAAVAVIMPWWIWCMTMFGTPLPTSGSAAHALSTALPFARESLGGVTGAIAGGPFEQWRGLRQYLLDVGGVAIVAFWVVVAALLFCALLWARSDRRAFNAAASLPAFAAALLVFYAWFGLNWYFTRYLAPVACVSALLIAIFVGRVSQLERSRRVPALAALLLLAVVPLGAAVRADARDITADERHDLAFDATTGYRSPAKVLAGVVPPGSVVGAWQSGAYGFYADRATVVNLDGVVNPDAAAAAKSNRLPFYIRDRGIGWLADSNIYLVGFTFNIAPHLDPVPSLVVVDDLPQFPPLPTHQIARIEWPKR
jgi:hypothetical protein